MIDAIQGDGFNPLWHQNLIVFNQGFTPHQFTSDEDVLAAAAGPNPEITIVAHGRGVSLLGCGPEVVQSRPAAHWPVGIPLEIPTARVLAERPLLA